MAGDTVTGTFVVTHADEASAVLQDVETGQVHTLAENPGLERHDALRGRLEVEPPMTVVWSVADVDREWTVTVERTDQTPTGQAREVAAGQAVGEVTTRERAGDGEVHVLTVPAGGAEEAAGDVVDDGATLTRAARLGVGRVEVRAAEADDHGVVSVRYLP